MRLFRKVGSVINFVGGGTVKVGVNIVGSVVERKYQETGRYIKDVGHTVVNASQKAIENTTHLADGMTNSLYGLATKDKKRQSDGLNDMKQASTKISKGVINGAVYTGKSISQTAKGAVRRDSEQLKKGLKNIGKVGAVTLIGVGVFEAIGVDSAEAMEIDTRNMELEGSTHETTNIPFERTVVETDKGELQSGVFPVFEPAFEMKLPDDTLQESDTVHAQLANDQLYKSIQQNPALADELGFTTYDIENLQSSATPNGYEWHHNENIGIMQLVEKEIHQQTGHTGGRAIWGGGTEAR